MIIKRFLVALVALSILTPNVTIAAPYGYNDPAFYNYFKYDVERGVFIDTTARMDNWCRMSEWRDPATGRRCGDPREIPPIRLVSFRTDLFRDSGRGSSVGTMRYRSAKEKVQDLARVVSIATAISADVIVAGKRASSKLAEARTVLIGLASRNRIVRDGELQDILNCSQNEIRRASDLVATDEKLAKMADTIWGAYSAIRITQVSREMRRAPTMTDVIRSASQAFGVEWQDVRMYATDTKNHPECSRALEVIVVVACDVLRKDVRLVARALALSESDVHALYCLGRHQLAGHGVIRTNALRVCRDLGAEPPTEWM
jgi:hypothetical protein